MQAQVADTQLLDPPLKGKKRFVIDNIPLSVDERYTVNKYIGGGAYGFVFSAFDAQTKSEVAIKKIPIQYADVVDTKRILREIKILSKYTFVVSHIFQNSLSMRTS